VWVWIGATIVTALGVGMVYANAAGGDAIAAIGSIVAFGDAIVFAWLVFQEGSAQAAGSAARS
jgi:hypothetical protein